ncbi:unnamed protein product, partial [Ranitomeya imitator]
MLGEVTEDNLIDLGPGSPAVVSPMVGNTAPASLTTQLGGLDVGSNSVSSTLSALPNTNPRGRLRYVLHRQGAVLLPNRGR